MRILLKILGWACIAFAAAGEAAEIDDLRGGEGQESVAGLRRALAATTS